MSGYCDDCGNTLCLCEAQPGGSHELANESVEVSKLYERIKQLERYPFEKLEDELREANERIKELDDLGRETEERRKFWKSKCATLQAANEVMKKALNKIRTQKLDGHKCAGDMALACREIADEALKEIEGMK